MLAIGPSTIPWSAGDFNGSFITVDVAENSILCIMEGLLLNDTSWPIRE